MHYLGAVRRLLADPLLFITLSLVIFVPGANLAVIGYLVGLAGESGPEAPFGKFRQRFLAGAHTIAVLVIYLLLPAVIYNFYSIRLTILSLVILLPFTVFAIVRLGNGASLEAVLEIENLRRAYSPIFVLNLLKAGLFTLMTLVVLLLVPLIGWIGLLFGPLAIFMSLMGQVYQDHFV